MFLNIVQSNLHSIYNSALTVIFTPVLQNQDKKHFSPKRLGAATKEFKCREIWFQIAFFSLNPLFCRFCDSRSAWIKMIAKFRWHCISFFSIVRNVNYVKKSLHPRNTNVVINHRVCNFILNSMLCHLSIKILHK